VYAYKNIKNILDIKIIKKNNNSLKKRKGKEDESIELFKG
jgi:hypothetical protein